MRSLILFLLLVPTGSAGEIRGATYTVTNLNDEGAGSFRQAIIDSNQSETADNILFGKGVSGTINLLSALPEIIGNLTISGPGSGTVALSRNSTDLFRLITVPAGAVLVIGGLTLKNGLAPTESVSKYTSAEGGGILNKGDLTVNDCVISSNRALASTPYGGGISNRGRLTVNRSQILSNQVSNSVCMVCVSRGGGIFNGGTAIIRDSDVSDSTNGGAVYTYFGSSLTIVNSNINSNKTTGIINNHGNLRVSGSSVSLNIPPPFSGYAGGLNNTGTAEIVNTTISGNQASLGGIFSTIGPMSLKNCTIVENIGLPDGYAGVYSQYSFLIQNSIVARNKTGTVFEDIDGGAPHPESSYNLIGNGDDFTLVNGVQGNMVGTALSPIDPKLGPLAFNGGRTKTHLPLTSSRAINEGTEVSLLGYDQRGVPRPVGTRDDVGAVEFNLLPHKYLPNGAVGFDYYQTLSAFSADGDAKFKFSITNGSLPPGLSIGNASPFQGEIFGIPETAGTFAFTVTAAGANEFIVSAELSITVLAENSILLVPVRGRVTTASGRGISRAFVQLIDPNGNIVRQSLANSSGYFTIPLVQTTETYTIQVHHKNVRSTPQAITVTGEINDLNLVIN